MNEALNISPIGKHLDRNFEHVFIGAGIAGLTAALSLAKFGLAVLVLEKAKQLDGLGAGIQLSPNATSILAQLGTLSALLPKATVVTSIDLIAARSTKSLLSLNTNTFASAQAPFLAVSRSDLQTSLLNAAQAHPNITLQTGVAADAQSEIIANAKCVIAADGVWSQTRLANGGGEAVYSGYVAQRATVDRDQLACAALKKLTTVSAFLAPHAHLVAYPIEHGSRINLVFIRKQAALTRGAPKSPTSMSDAPAYLGFAPSLALDLRRITNWTDWPIFTVPIAQRWRVNDRTMLIGDAAHATLPFAAQGAGMAIEDGFTIAHCLYANQSNTELAFNAYEQHRRFRVQKIARRAQLNAFAYHASGPVALARNLTFALKGQQLMQDLKWLYDYRVPGL